MLLTRITSVLCVQDEAGVLIIRGGVAHMLSDKKVDHRAAYAELESLLWDTKAKMKGRVVGLDFLFCFDPFDFRAYVILCLLRSTSTPDITYVLPWLRKSQSTRRAKEEL